MQGKGYTSKVRKCLLLIILLMCLITLIPPQQAKAQGFDPIFCAVINYLRSGEKVKWGENDFYLFADPMKLSEYNQWLQTAATALNTQPARIDVIIHILWTDGYLDVANRDWYKAGKAGFRDDPNLCPPPPSGEPATDPKNKPNPSADKSNNPIVYGLATAFILVCIFVLGLLFARKVNHRSALQHP
jgi:hypothetical protein